MVETAPKEPRKMPKGGKKGGKRFPQYPLNDAVKWADKLVSKTHSGSQADDLIKASVVEAKSGVGDMRISALKQFGLMVGTSKGYSATELAKDLKSAPQDEKSLFYKTAALKSEIFEAIFETFHGDSISLAKLNQRAADLQVHPDSTSKCVDVYVETMEFAGLLSRNGDLIVHLEKETLASAGEKQVDNDEIDQEFNDDHQDTNILGISKDDVGKATRRGVATVQVNINLDSSLDTDKLQRQLELLRRYGAL